MRKATKATPQNAAIRPSNTLSQLPDGLGSLHFRSGSFWMSYRLPDGCRVQGNTHSKNITAARVMLAERALQRVAALTLHLEEVVREGSAALAGQGFHKLADGSWAGTSPDDRYDARGTGRANQRAKAAVRNRQEAAR